MLFPEPFPASIKHGPAEPIVWGEDDKVWPDGVPGIEFTVEVIPTSFMPNRVTGVAYSSIRVPYDYDREEWEEEDD